MSYRLWSLCHKFQFLNVINREKLYCQRGPAMSLGTTALHNCLEWCALQRISQEPYQNRFFLRSSSEKHLCWSVLHPLPSVVVVWHRQELSRPGISPAFICLHLHLLPSSEHPHLHEHVTSNDTCSNLQLEPSSICFTYEC